MRTGRGALHELLADLYPAAGQLPLALVSGELFGHELAGGEVLLVLVGASLMGAL